jgi:hypothetical protein
MLEVGIPNIKYHDTRYSGWIIRGGGYGCHCMSTHMVCHCTNNLRYLYAELLRAYQHLLPLACLGWRTCCRTHYCG